MVAQRQTVCRKIRDARLVFVKTAQGYLPGIPLTLQTLVFACAQFVVKITGLEKKWQVYFS
jgi:hypothetical protein